MPKLTKKTRVRKQMDRYLMLLDKMDQTKYFDCDGKIYFRALAGQQAGRPVGYRQKLINRRRK